MCPLNAELLRTAKRLKLIIQYGVGVEGIDIPVVGPLHPAWMGVLICALRLARFESAVQQCSAKQLQL